MGYKDLLARLEVTRGDMGDGPYCRCVIEIRETFADEDQPAGEDLYSVSRQPDRKPCPKCGLPYEPGRISVVEVVRPREAGE